MAYALIYRDRAVQRFSLASAYVALALLAVSLVIGPYNVLRGRPNPVSSSFRRDVGIWSALIGIAHVVAGIQVHLVGRPWLYFLYDRSDGHRVPIRHDLFGLANYSGLGATVLLALLLCLSNDRMLRQLGTRRWKRIQRYNYATFALVVVHAAAFQVIETRGALLVALCSAMILATLVFQAAGYRSRRQTERQLG